MSRSRIWLFSLFAFVLFSWPVVFFPLTDGDVANWTDSAVELSQTGYFFSGTNDQAHGPLMVWTAAVCIKLLGQTFYALNFFNLIMGVIGAALVYFFSSKIWNDDRVGQLSAFFYVTSIAPVYLSRTPMYDWPAAVLYTAFCGFYYLACRDKNKTYFALALGAIAVASLSRFSIALGLAGFFIIGTQWVMNRSIKNIIRDGFLLTLSIIAINAPWFLGQMHADGNHFLHTFLYDNTGRFVKSTRPHAHFNADFYGFPLYVLVGMLPFTFCLIGSFFKKNIIERFKQDKRYIILLCAFLPCLVLFSISGHTKLARYISYVFPFMMMLLAAFMVHFDLSDPTYRRKAGTLIKWTAGLLSLLLVQQAVYFFDETKQSMSFVVATVVMLLSLLGAAFYCVTKKADTMINASYKLLPIFGGIYGLYFTFLTYEMYHVPFLIEVRLMIEAALLGK